MSVESKQSEIDKCFENAKARLRENDAQKQDIIHDLAEQLEGNGMPKDMIAAEIEKRLREWVSSYYIRKVLGDDYTRKYEWKISQPVAIQPSLEKVEQTASATTQDRQMQVFTIRSDERKVPEDITQSGQVLESPPPPPLSSPSQRSEEDIEEIRYLREQLTAARMQDVVRRIITIDLDKFEKYIRLAFLNKRTQLSVHLNEKYEVIKVE